MGIYSGLIWCLQSWIRPPGGERIHSEYPSIRAHAMVEVGCIVTCMNYKASYLAAGHLT